MNAPLGATFAVYLCTEIVGSLAYQILPLPLGLLPLYGHRSWVEILAAWRNRAMSIGPDYVVLCLKIEDKLHGEQGRYRQTPSARFYVSLYEVDPIEVEDS